MSAPTLTLGTDNDWAETSTPPSQGNSSNHCYGFRPIALWSANSVNFETYSTVKRLGVVAYHGCGPANGHGGVQKVRIIGNNGPPLDITEPTLNEVSGFYEFHFNVPARAADGPVQIRAIVYPEDGEPFVLQGGYVTQLTAFDTMPEPDGCVVLWSNANGTYDGLEYHVATGGSDAAAGTIGAPLATIGGAIGKANGLGQLSHLKIRLATGTYLMNGGGGALTQSGWITIKPEDGVDWEDVHIVGKDGGGSAESRTRLVHLEDLTVDLYGSNDSPFFSSNVNYTGYLWCSGVRMVSDLYLTGSAKSISGGAYIQRYMHKSAAHERNLILDGREMAQFLQMQDFNIINTSRDVLNPCRLARGFRIEGMIAIGGDHLDGIQTFSTNPAGNCLWMDGEFVGGVSVNAIIFNDRMRGNIGFINLVLSCLSGSYSVMCGGSHVLFWHVTMPDQQMQLTADPHDQYDTGGGVEQGFVSFVNSIVSFRFSGGDTAPLMEFNDFVTDAISSGNSVYTNNQLLPGGLEVGTDYEVALPTWVDEDGFDFHAPDVRMVPRFLEHDANQSRRQAMTAAGAYVRTDEAPTIPRSNLRDVSIVAPGKQLTFAGDEDTVIYITQDGSTPNEFSTEYAGALTLTADVVVKARAYLDGTGGPVRTINVTVVSSGTPSPPYMQTRPPGGLVALRFQAGDVSTTETGFRIKTRIDGAVAPWRADKSLGALAGTGLTIDETLALYLPNTLYNWQIVAVNDDGEGDIYGPFSIYTRPGLAPSGLTATPASGSQINLAWTAGNPVTGYRIYACLAGGILAPIAVVSAVTLSYNIAGLLASEAYDIAVVAYNSNAAFDAADAETYKDTVGAFTVASTLPVVVSVTVTRTTTTVVFSEALSVGDDVNVPTLTLSGGAITLTYASGNGTNTRVYTNSRDVGFSETGTAAYVQNGDGLQAGDGRLLAALSGQVVTNASDFGAMTYLTGTSNIGDSTTGNPIDTTGADLIVFLIGGQFAFYDGVDSEGNTWTRLEQTGGGNIMSIYYCVNPTTSAAHTFWAATPSAPYNAIVVAAFSGVSAFDKATGAFSAASTTTIQPGAQTPASAPCLSVVGVAISGDTDGFSSPGYTLGPNLPSVTGLCYGGAILYAVLPTTTSNNPVVTFSTGASVEYVENILFN